MMREADKLAFEERVLAYFDGALDDASSERLLSEVAADSEKEQIFSAHQELDKLIMTARVPFETPEETRRSIAAVIPGLTTYLPELITGGSTVSLLASRWRALLDFFTQTPLRTALTIGGAAAIVTTGVVVTKNIATKSAEDHLASRNTIEHTATVAPQAVASTQRATSDATLGLRSAATASVASGHGVTSLKGPASVTSNHLSNSIADGMEHLTPSSDHTNAFSNDARNLDIARESTSLTPAVLDEQPAEPSTGSIAEASIRGAANNAVNWPAMSNDFRPVYSAPRVYSEPLGITVSAGFGSRVLFMPSVDGTSRSADVSTPFSASVRVPISGAVNLLAEGGSAAFVRVRQTGSVVNGFGALQHFLIATSLVTENAAWSRIGAEYQLSNDSWSLTPFVSATAGVAFTEKMAPMVGVATGFKWYWTDAIKFIGTIGYDQTWVRRETEKYVVPESAIVDVRDLRGGMVTNSALTVNIGLSTTF